MQFSKYKTVYRDNIKLAFPVILSQAGQMSVNLIDNMMVGHVGTVELAAAAFTINILHIGMLFGIGFSIGITPLVGHAYGDSNDNRIGEWLKNGTLLHLLMAIVIVGFMYGLYFFLDQMGQEKLVVKAAKPYYLLQVASLFPMLLFFTGKQFLEGIGNTRLAMYITLVSNVLNVILNYVLIFGKLGMPAMGLNGAGISTLISRIILPIILFVVILKHRKYIQYIKRAANATIKISCIKRLFAIGFPIGLHMIVEILAFNFGAIMIGWISKESLAAHQVAIGLVSFTYMIAYGLGSGTVIQVSHLIGNKNTPEMKRVITASIHLVILFMAVMGVSMVIFRNYIPFLFTNDKAVIEIASKLLIVGALFQVFDGVQVILISALRGMADVNKPMWLAFLSYIAISLPIGYFSAFIFNFDAIGIWFGYLAGLGAAAILFSFRIKSIFMRL